ncbi:transcriptional regulator [Fervidicoccus fontis]|uniref:Transcriptional regulator n=2 Tax=Fervidicoccus fontis TaxID=683846 RepID=A0A7C2ZU28_9CREN|nr:transcriptional regulator [Fervidicoccus fontis]MBE9390890.1 transcriptional regulator [Fervidicoccus fontis]PMB78028.1 MAG: transcriptional regulator [Fervidicoccus fontis]HEW64451.1 transcriptional regulator [Fervidicoccus fontis]
MSEVPLKPVGKEEIRKLELALIIATLFREDVLQQALETKDKLTWLDSLIVAAGALARERAGIPASRIAEELERTEATIRNHLSGKTDAGKMVKETYEQLVKSGGSLSNIVPEILVKSSEEEKCKERLELVKQKIEEIKKLLE